VTFPNPDTQFKKGQSGNPAGRPPGKNRSTVLREIYDMIIAGKDVDGLEKQMPVEYHVMKALAMKAMEGDVSAIKEAQDTLYGKVKDVQEVDLRADVTQRDVTAQVLSKLPTNELEAILEQSDDNEG
jgi:hypothetical protein